MANLEVLALDTAVPQIRAPGAGDGYSVPRDMTMASGTTLSAQALTAAGNVTLSGGTANGVLYLNASKVATSGSALTFDGSTLAATTVDATNVEATNVKAKDGTAAITIADSTGNVGIGGTASSFSKFEVTGTLPTSSNTTQTIRQSGTLPSGSTSDSYGYVNVLNTAAASFTCAGYSHYFAFQSALGAGSAVTNQFGFHAGSTLTGATNNYGFYSNIASGSNRWNFYAAGTAENYFAGKVGIGAAPTCSLLVFTGNTTDGIRIQRFAGNYYSELRQTDAQEGLAFLVGDGSTVSEKLRIKGTGQTRFQPRSGNPGGAEAGDVYYDSSDNKLKVYNGTSWVDLH